MTRYGAEKNVYDALGSTNAEIRESQRRNPNGLRKVFRELFLLYSEWPTLGLLVSLILFGLIPGLFVFVSWMITLGPVGSTAGIVLFLVAQFFAMPLAITMWLVLADDKSVTTKEFRTIFLRHFHATYNNDYKTEEAAVDRALASIEIRSGFMRLLLGGILLSLIINVLSNKDFQQCGWAFIQKIAEPSPSIDSIFCAAGKIWSTNPLGALSGPTIIILLIVYGGRYGVAHSWLRTIKVDLLQK